MQNLSSELDHCIIDLKEKRDVLDSQIRTEEAERAKVTNEIRIATERLARINESLSAKHATRNDYNATLQDTEAAYMKILESSQTLLHCVKRETEQLKNGSGAGS